MGIHARKKQSRANEAAVEGSWQVYANFFRHGLMGSVALGLCVSAVAACSTSFGSPFLFSSATSPDGVWIAENFGTDGCCSGGFVLIHKKSEPPVRSDAVIFSPSGAGGLFMIWQDDNRLALVQDSNDEPVHGPRTYRGITIVHSTYRNRIYDKHTFDAANVSKQSLNIKDADVSAETDQATTKTGRRCGLSLSASDGAVYDKIGMRIEASINRCNGVSNCAGISSEFWVGKRIDGRHGIALTSATVSDVPPVSQRPTGDRNSIASGGFSGSSAIELMGALGSKSLAIQYSLNFFDTILSYHIATERLTSTISSFEDCVGDADFNWDIHTKAEPARSDAP